MFSSIAMLQIEHSHQNTSKLMRYYYFGLAAVCRFDSLDCIKSESKLSAIMRLKANTILDGEPVITAEHSSHKCVVDTLKCVTVSVRTQLNDIPMKRRFLFYCVVFQIIAVSVDNTHSWDCAKCVHRFCVARFLFPFVQ